MKKLIIKDFLIITGGDVHSGWLPNVATEPLPTPVKEILSDLAIEELEKDGGFLLLHESKDGLYYGDTWHRSVEEALEVAEEDFGVPKGLWKETN